MGLLRLSVPFGLLPHPRKTRDREATRKSSWRVEVNTLYYLTPA